MSKQNKVPRPDIRALRSLDSADVYINSGQMFYETPKTFEIWQEQPLRYVTHILKSQVYWALINDMWRTI